MDLQIYTFLVEPRPYVELSLPLGFEQVLLISAPIYCL